MARLSPPNHLRLRQAMPGTLEVTFAGAEANTAVAITALGGRARLVTALPRNEIADACCAALRAAEVDVTHIVHSDEGRFGLYFVETGANQRAGNVLYDRVDSAFSLAGPDAYPWNQLLSGASWLHTTGIAAGVSRVAAAATLAAVRAARVGGLTVSLDLNFRRKLWRWDAGREPDELYRRTLAELMAHVDVVIGNGADLAAVAGLPPPAAGASDLTQLAALARAFVRRFPCVRRVAMTLREGVSATHNRWGALLFEGDGGSLHVAPTAEGNYAPYEITGIVDRLGTGDAFAGALIFALQTPELAAPATAVRFAVAASCLAHSISGDFNFCTRSEVEALMQGNSGGGISR